MFGLALRPFLLGQSILSHLEFLGHSQVRQHPRVGVFVGSGGLNFIAHRNLQVR